MKTTSILSIIILVILSHCDVAAQSCTPLVRVGAANSTPTWDSLACVERTVPYSTTIYIENFDSSNFANNPFPTIVDSIRFDTIINLPAGMNYVVNPNSRLLSRGQTGCVSIYGTTSDTVGIYHLQFNISIWARIIIAGIAQNIYRTNITIDSMGSILGPRSDGFLDYYIRVKDFGSNICPTFPPQLSINSLCQGQINNLESHIQFGNGPFTYIWSTGDTTANISNVPAGNYALTITDADSITITSSIFIASQNCVVNFEVLGDTNICLGGSTMLWANVANNNSYSFTWTPVVGLSCNTCSYVEVNPTVTTTYTVTATSVVDTFTQQITINVGSACSMDVWPGDATNNGVADVADVLYLATCFGYSGPVRVGASNNWVGQSCADWSGSILSDNMKFIDCDGNGIINWDDTLAITMNYGQSHPKTSQRALPTDPVLIIVPMEDTLHNNALLHLKLMLGDQSTPVDSLYGLAFSMNLDPAIFDTTAATIDLTNSWMGTDLISFRKALPVNKTIDMVIARKDRQNINGYGEIGTLTLRTKNDLSTGAGINHINFNPTIIKGITATGVPRTFNTHDTTVAVRDTFTGIAETVFENTVTIFPNPTTGHFTFTMQQPSKQLRVELFNAQGMLVQAEQLTNITLLKKDINVSNLSKGVYLLKLSCDSGVVVKRIVVQ